MVAMRMGTVWPSGQIVVAFGDGNGSYRGIRVTGEVRWVTIGERGSIALPLAWVLHVSIKESALSAFLILSGILGALLLGAMSPQPSFVLVSRIAAGSSRGDGLAAAFGMGLGGALFAGLALFGLVAVLTQAEWLYLALRVGGGMYLIHLGIRIWRGASEPLNLSAGRATGLYRQAPRPCSSLSAYRWTRSIDVTPNWCPRA